MLLAATVAGFVGIVLFPQVRADDDPNSKSERIPAPKAEKQVQNPGSAEQSLIYQTQWRRLQAVTDPTPPPAPIPVAPQRPASAPNSASPGVPLATSSVSATTPPPHSDQKAVAQPHVEKPQPTPRPAPIPADSGVRQVSATVANTMPLECYGEAIFTEEELTEKPKRDPVLTALEDSIRRRLSVRCGCQPREVQVTPQNDWCMRIRISAHNPAEAKEVAAKILQTPELEPFQILLDVAIVH